MREMWEDCTSPHKEPTALVSEITLHTKESKPFFGASRTPIRTRLQWAGLYGMLNHCQESSLFQGIALAQLGSGSELQES